MPDRRPLSIVNGVISELPTTDRLGGQLAANAAGQVATYEQIGSSPLFGFTALADGTTLSVATHGNKRLPINGGTINLPADASWPTDIVFEFVSVGTNPTIISWTGNTIVSQNTGSAASQTVGGNLASSVEVKKMSAGVAYITTGVAGTAGINAIATITGTPPVTPAVSATANYTVDSSAGLILLAYYSLTNIAGAFLLTAISGTTITLQNVNVTVGATVTTGMRLGATAKPIIEYTGVPYRSGTDITIATNAVALSVTPQSAGSLRAFHWEVKRTVIITAIRQEVTTGQAGATFRLALYADNGSLYPGTLIANSDTILFDGAATGVKVGTFSAPIALAPGSYFLGVNNSSNPTFRIIPLTALSATLGQNPAGGANASYTGYAINQAFGAMPATFPAGANLATNLAPATMFRVQ